MEGVQAARPEDFGIGRFFYEMRDAVVVADVATQKIILWNPAAEKILGYGHEEAQGMLVEELVPQELRALHRTGISRYAKTRKGELVDAHRAVELQAIHKNGDILDIELVFAPLDRGPSEGVFVAAFIRDISDRKALEREAQRASDNMRLILESTGEGIYGIDTAGTCTFVNYAVAEMMGYRVEEMEGRNMHELLHHSRPDGSPYPVQECPIFRSFQVGRGCRVDDEVMWRKDGTPVPVRYSAFPIIAQGTVTGAVVSMSDVTQRKMLEDSLRQATARSHEAYEKEKEAVETLKNLDQLKNDFVAMVAHDLKSPMTVIGGLADTMTSKWDRLDDTRKIEFLGLISGNVRRLADLVDDVLQVARIESNEISYVIEPFDLGMLVQKTVAEQREGYRDRTIEISAPESLPLALADDQRVWQVLGNLLSNALKFSPSDTPVSVSVTHDDEDLLRVSVTDQGGGIRPEEMDKLFQKFSRLTQTGGGQAKGTGLGLFICKRMIEEQGGRIWADSVLGEGSTFTFTLPPAPGS